VFENKAKIMGKCAMGASFQSVG